MHSDDRAGGSPGCEGGAAGHRGSPRTPRHFEATIDYSRTGEFRDGSKRIVATDTQYGDSTVERVVNIRRCSAVVKGGRRFSFAAMTVVGNGKGRAGWGYGKANEVPPSVEKANKQAARQMIEVPLQDGTIPHPVLGQFGAGRVLLMPAGPGTGIIAGAAVRSVCEAAGIKNILTKSYGTNNPITVVKAAFQALGQLRTLPEVERLRGVRLS